MNLNSNPAQFRTQSVSPKSSAASPEWIAGRIRVLLSHYFRPDDPEEVRDAALVDWITALNGFSAEQIDAACADHIRKEAKWRPSPASIRERCEKRENRVGQGDPNALSRDEQDILFGTLIPRWQKWLGIPGLEDHARQSLGYWGQG